MFKSAFYVALSLTAALIGVRIGENIARNLPIK